jgi:hypothetical protein
MKGLGLYQERIGTSPASYGRQCGARRHELCRLAHREWRLRFLSRDP